MRAEKRNGTRRGAGGLLTAGGLGALAVVCCAGLPWVVGALGGLSVAALFGIGVGVLAACALVAAAVMGIARGRSSCAPEAAPTEPTECAGIGPLGVLARTAVGVCFIAFALLWRHPRWHDATLGLLVLPAVVTTLLLVRARRSGEPLRATGPVGHIANLAILVPLFVLPATAGAAFLFYGISMLVAAARRSGGCEVTAISNALLDRDDQVGCVLFTPVDAAERRIGGSRRQIFGSTLEPEPHQVDDAQAHRA